MATESKLAPDNQDATQHGGRREGAGRHKRSTQELERWWSARGISPLHASEILARCTDERKTWVRILSDDDTKTVLQAMMFLVSMRDGRPAQQINLTSLNLNVSAEDIAEARAIVRELRGSPQPVDSEEDTIEGNIVTLPTPPLMLSGDEGGKEVGDGGESGG